MKKPMTLTCALLSIGLASCVLNTRGSSEQVQAPAEHTRLLFLRDAGPSLPAIGRAMVGHLSSTQEGCVYLSGPEPLLIIWPPDAAFSHRGQSFRTAQSGELRLGMVLTFSGYPVRGPLEVSTIGGVEVPAPCREMSILHVAPDGARRGTE